MFELLKIRFQKFCSSRGYNVQPCLSSRKDLNVYQRLYSQTAISERKFYNIGAGSFKHSCWTNIDHPSDWYAKKQSRDMIEWDLLEETPCAVESGSAEIVYTSHVIEHITDAAAKTLFREAYRMLKPGGYLRVTAPDMQLAYQAYSRNDIDFFCMFPPQSNIPIEMQFLSRFATQLCPQNPHCIPAPPTKEEVREAFAHMLQEDAFSLFSTRCSIKIQKKWPSDHINWRTTSKVKTMLNKAGFKDAYISHYAQSRSAVLRNTSYFDNTRPSLSLYLEAQKQS